MTVKFFPLYSCSSFNTWWWEIWWSELCCSVVSYCLIVTTTATIRIGWS